MFFRLPQGDAVFLGAIFLLSALGFVIPSLRSMEFAGIALFGWWMAALMFFGPLIALIRMLQRKR